MKGLSLRWWPYELTLRAPLVTAGGTVRRRCGLLVRLEDADGVSGYGDVAPWPGSEDEALPAASAWLEAVRRAVREPVDVVRAVTTYPARSAAEIAARAGLETAFADWCARRVGRPLAQWLRADAAAAVPVNALLGVADTATTVAQARAAVQAGFRTLKLKVALTPEEVERVQAVRAAVGRDVRLRLDTNGTATVEAAVAFARAVAPLAVEYLEQPVATLEECAALRRRSPVPLALDETLLGPGAVERALELGAADVLVLKLPLLGGPRAVLAAAELARSRGVDVVVTGMLESGVGLAAAVHLAAAVGGNCAHGLALAQLVESLGIAEGLEPVDGVVRVPTAPGLGVTVLSDRDEERE